MKRERAIKATILGLTFTFAAGLAILFFSTLYSLATAFGAIETTHTSDATAFYEKEVKDYIKLPSDARIEKIDHTDDWIDDYYVLTIRTDSKLPPERWVKNLWADNRFAPSSKVSSTEYEAYQTQDVDPTRSWKQSTLHHGHRRIYYDAKSNRYRVEIGTD